jgi:lysophospholipase L1-like esterase
MTGPATVGGVPFPQDNEGHSGWTIAEIQTLVPTPALQPMPDIILLMAGTNDMYTTATEMGAPQRLGSLIDTIVTDAPNALLVVAQLTPLGNSSYEMNVEAYNASIPAVVQQRVSAGKHILLVDMHTGFDVSTMLDTVDMIHPNDQGYIFMGDRWYGAIKAVLP